MSAFEEAQIEAQRALAKREQVAAEKLAAEKREIEYRMSRTHWYHDILSVRAIIQTLVGSMIAAGGLVLFFTEAVMPLWDETEKAQAQVQEQRAAAQEQWRRAIEAELAEKKAKIELFQLDQHRIERQRQQFEEDKKDLALQLKTLNDLHRQAEHALAATKRENESLRHRLEQQRAVLAARLPQLEHEEQNRAAEELGQLENQITDLTEEIARVEAKRAATARAATSARRDQLKTIFTGTTWRAEGFKDWQRRLTDDDFWQAYFEEAEISALLGLSNSEIALGLKNNGTLKLESKSNLDIREGGWQITDQGTLRLQLTNDFAPEFPIRDDQDSRLEAQSNANVVLEKVVSKPRPAAAKDIASARS